MPKATIKNISGAGTWDSPNGILYKFEYSFDDNVTIKVNHKTERPPFSEGNIVEYEIKGTNTYGSWGKVSRPESEPFDAPQPTKGTQPTSAPKRGGSQAGSFALSYAKDVYIGLYGPKEPAEVAQDITEIAEIFKTWLDEN
tara:strand:+ start:4211 stop:4633 length:423 start_codon:yes stop_codon:yes gene_type:complete